MKLLFIGGGKMMQAIAGGLLSQHAKPEIYVVEPDTTTREVVQAHGAIAFADAEGVLASIKLAEIDTLILAVKPQVMRAALAPFAGKLTTQLVVSIAAGIRTHELTDWLQHSRIVRAMPNTPALIQAGITGLYADSAVDIAGRNAATALLATVGKTVWFDEEPLLDAVTAVSGSGPAYAFYMIEALEEAALALGFTGDAARLFAVETFRGACLLAAQSTDPPATLRANVTSKRGTTEAAIQVLDEEAVKARFVRAVKAAAARATALGEEFAAAKP
jgi:pyrroline-5-carboxylate reductase